MFGSVPRTGGAHRVLNFADKKLMPRIEVIPGNAAAADPTLPFAGLNQFA